jgi:hypothetical protein
MSCIQFNNAISLALLLFLVSFTVVESAVVATKLRGAVFSNQTDDVAETPMNQRRLQSSIDIRDFKTLVCNSNLSKNTCTKTWSSVFGTSNSHTRRIVIPCGECITMDHASGILDLKGGIDIIGKLVFPDGYKINLTVTSVIVQGELVMTATKQVDGIPSIKFTMVGTSDDLTFTPVDVNANACKGVSTCTVGKKSIVVAGGKVSCKYRYSNTTLHSMLLLFCTCCKLTSHFHSIHFTLVNGVRSNTPSWTRLHDVRGGTLNNPDMLVVPSTVSNRWGVGAQILITSHTFDWDIHQVRTITSFRNVGVIGHVGLQLNETIIRPTTAVESPDFAVEVAMLSRNIRFEGARDDTAFPRHGGHFIVFHTPVVIQNIRGVEFKNFGQQGTLGRYPIHFHHSSDVTGSVVSKNSIHQSNQRCVVAHGTNNLRIEENVAYNTKGHCYLTEDGIETGNQFIMNLGVETRAVETIIPRSASANNGDESDNEPATFWINNPTNSWIGNVAAGSQDSGFWFEPSLRGTRLYLVPKDYDPEVELLTLFKNNVVHSTDVSTTLKNHARSFVAVDESHISCSCLIPIS